MPAVQQFRHQTTSHVGERSSAHPRTPFSRFDFERDPGELLHGGRWANADVRLFRHAGKEWVVKDFGPRFSIVRETIGALFTTREIVALQRLADIPGVPAEVFRVDRHAFAYRFTPGRQISELHRTPLTAEFFRALETLLHNVHARGIVHLDVRCASNVLVSDQGQPLLIDFQSNLRTQWMPRGLRRWMEEFDLAGAYKHWARADPDSLDPARAVMLKRMNRWRKFWFLRGYLGIRRRN